MLWRTSYYVLTINNLLNYFKTLSIKFHYSTSVLGFFIIIVFTSQILSGIMLSFSLIPEPMFIPIVRDEEDLEDLVIDDFFWLHERGVDFIFIFTYCHLFRKLYLLLIYIDQEFAWKSGIFLLILIQVVTFLGLVLCGTHLSDITLKIASNALHTVFFFKSKVYWWLFTDKNLNSDTMIRLAYAHYVSAFVLFFLAVIHAMDMHYDWKNDYNSDFIKNELNWWGEVITNEVWVCLELSCLIYFLAWYLYPNPQTLTYEIFMWGDIGHVIDPNFNQVAPHWYFRPLMAFLLVIPNALLGYAGLALFFILLFFQISINNIKEINWNNFKINNLIINHKINLNLTQNLKNLDFSLFTQIVYYVFLLACAYTLTFLPNGKYYQLVGGNNGMLAAYIIILSYLTFSNLKYFNSSTEYWYELKNFFFQFNSLYTVGMYRNYLKINVDDNFKFYINFFLFK